MESEEDASPASSSPVVDDVLHAYCEAHRHAPAMEAMNVARRAAEAVSLALLEEMPGGERPRITDLNKRLEALEKSFASGQVDVPRFLLAALRTLQAYGNCGSHYQLGIREAPSRAAESALASLAYVTEWFVGRQQGANGSDISKLVLREPVPGVPTFFERRRLRARVGKKAPQIAERADADAAAVVRKDDPVEVQLASLLTFHNSEVQLVRDVASVVFEREVAEDVPEDFRELVLRMASLSGRRPDRVPIGIVRSMEDVLTRRTRMLNALHRECPTATEYVEEARARSPAEEVLTWFERGYLGDTGAVRRWAKVAVAVVIAIGSFRACENAGEKTGRNTLRVEILRDVCAGAEGPPVCERLRGEQRAYDEELARQSNRR